MQTQLDLHNTYDFELSYFIQLQLNVLSFHQFVPSKQLFYRNFLVFEKYAEFLTNMIYRIKIF